MASSERFSGLRSVRAPEEIVCRLTVEGPPRDYVGVVTALPVRKFNAFTTSELVVVLAIVSAITVLVLPGFNASREKERRVRCSRGLHILSVSAQLYATDHRDLLYNNLPESGFWDTQCLPPRTYALMTNGIDPRSVDCPGLYPFTIPGLVEKPGGRLRKGGGVLIGYNYLGGMRVGFRPSSRPAIRRRRCSRIQTIMETKTGRGSLHPIELLARPGFGVRHFSGWICSSFRGK